MTQLISEGFFEASAAVRAVRTSSGVVVAPQAVPWPITGGQVAADLAPGPARLTVDCGPYRRTFDVTIPDTPVSLADLIGVAL